MAMGSGPLAPRVIARVARAIPPGSAICVGFSGGLDSTVLLDLLADHAREARYGLAAVHVHHGLSPNADAWARSCERFCAERGVPFAVERVRVEADSPLGLEAAAREARYAVFARRTEPYVALAHHLDDQAETVLLRLLRGTGIKGIGAMPEMRPLPGSAVQVFRPLLEHSRAELRTHAESRGLRWIDDESNASLAPQRNFLRHAVAPLIDPRMPAWREALARFARHAGEASELLEELATIDGVPLEPGEPWPLRPDLSVERRANALRAFLARNAVSMPTEARLAEMQRQLFEARDDARVRIDHDGVSIVRHRGSVFAERGLDAASPWRVEWRRERDLELGGDRGSVHFEPMPGEGIAIAAEAAGEWYFASRSGGETLRLGAGRPSRTLKNLLQEHDVAPWQRERLPLLFHDGRLVWVPGIGIAAEYACGAAAQGLRPSWRVAGKALL
jgi:tRNA(Ile)-lysidine synthase